MTDEERRRLEAAAKGVWETWTRLDIHGNLHVQSRTLAKAAIDAYNRPLEPEIPQLVEDMATAIDGVVVKTDTDFRTDQARAALRVVVRKLLDE